jgi:hypothetical protein
MAGDQFHPSCPGCWAEMTPSEQRPAGILDHRHEEQAIRRFKITLKDGSKAHVTAAGFRREDFIVFYDSDRAEVKTVRARLVGSILDEAYQDRIVRVHQNDLGSA